MPNNDAADPRLANGEGRSAGSSSLVGVAQEGGAAPEGGSGAAAGSAIETGEGKSSKPNKRIRATKTQNRPGVLRVKEYPITEDTLDNIGTLRVSAAFWFAIGSLALGFALSAWQSLELADGSVTDATKASWTAYRNMGAAAAVIAYVAGVFYFLKGKSVIQFVKDNTIHDPLD